MEKITFLENIGGFFIAPKKHTKYILDEEERNWKSMIFQSFLFVFACSLFAGCVLMFYMMYPEVFWVPGALHTGRLFVYAAAHPLFIVGMFGLGILFVFLYDFLVQGSLSYLIVKLTIKTRDFSLTFHYGRYLSLYSYTHIHSTLFHMITVLWMYFFEKFAYTKIFFPVTDLTLPVIIHLIILSVFVVLKWIWEMQINIGIFEWANIPKSRIRNSIIIFLVVRFVITAAILMVAYFSGNLIAGAQWS